MRVSSAQKAGESDGEGFGEPFGTVVKAGEQVDKQPRDLVLPLRMALQPNDPTVLRTFQPLH